LPVEQRRIDGVLGDAGEVIVHTARVGLGSQAAMNGPLSDYLDGEQAVLYRSKMNPSLGRNFEDMDPLEWLAAWPITSRSGQAQGPFYGHHTSRIRDAGASRAEPPTAIGNGSTATNATTS
jgi:hypothetical protein